MTLIISFLAIALPVLAGIFLSPAQVHASPAWPLRRHPAATRMRWMNGAQPRGS